MNIKAITRAMELSDDDWELATKLRALSEPERELLMTALGPQKPAAKKPGKKAGKKSARASGMAEQLNKTLQQQRRATSDYCAHVFSGGDRCNESESSGIHDVTMGYQNYHPFVPPASSAPPPSDQASFEIGKGAAGHAVGGSNG